MNGVTNTVRHTESEVCVSYGNGDVSTRMKFESKDTSPSSNYATLYNQRHEPTTSAFTLEGGNISEMAKNYPAYVELEKKGELKESDRPAFEILKDFTLGSGRGLADRHVIGWWSSSFSKSELSAREGGGYEFDKSPTLTISFTGKRPIKQLDIYGDAQLREYPVEFCVTVTRDSENDTEEEKEAYEQYTNASGSADLTVYRTGKKTDVTKNFVCDKDEEMTTKYHKTLTFIDKKSTPELYAINNGYITNVEKITLVVKRWNKPNRVSKIYRFFDDIVESYSGDELQSVEVIYEASNSGNIEYGLVSGSCAMTLLNKDRKFDLGYLSDMVHTNRRVVPYINGTKLGTFFIKQWEVPQDGLFVNCKANDRLMDFQDIKFCGIMPNPKCSTPTKMSFYELFEFVLNYASDQYTALNSNAAKIEFVIDERLKYNSGNHSGITSVQPYLPRDSVWAVLELLCKASMSFVYVDRDDVIRVVSELFDDTANTTEYASEITKHNAFSINIPFLSDMTANSVEIPYYYKEDKKKNNSTGTELGDDLDELCRIEGVDLIANIDTPLPYELNCYGEMEKVEYKTADGVSTYLAMESTESAEQLKLLTGTLTVYPKKTVSGVNITIKGKKTTFNKQTHSDKNPDSVNANGLSLYTHPDCELIQGKALAEKIGDRILNRYIAGTKSADCQWVGNENLQLFDTYALYDRFDKGGEYQTTYVKSTMDGGFRQEVKGVLRKKLKDRK